MNNLSPKALLLVWIMLMSCLSLFSVKLTISEFEHEIWRLTNLEREKYQLPALVYEDGLSDLARAHSRNMLYLGFFNHKDHKGDMVSDRHTRYYPELILSSIGENLARFTNSAKVFSPQDIVEGWMNSPEHRENILDAGYTHLGVGVMIHESRLLATQNFATAIAKLNHPLPKKMNRKDTYRLEFTYLSPKPWQTFNAVLRYPNHRTRYVLDEKHYTLGGEPVTITWLDEHRFAINLKFNAGKGSYYLNFGFNGGYFEEGVKLKVK